MISKKLSLLFSALFTVLLFAEPQVSLAQQTAETASDTSTEEKARLAQTKLLAEPEVNLPDQLTLADALNLASGQHPSLLSAEAKSIAAKATLIGSGANQAWAASLNLEGRYADRANNDTSTFIDDSRVELKISKLLTDFGQGSAAITAANIGLKSSQMNLDYAKRLRRIDVMARYLDVVAADYKFAADNEAMSLAFFPWNRAQERRERFDSVSEVTVLRLRSEYQKVLAKRNKTQQRQRESRFRLATAMGWPDAKPVSVQEPDLSIYQRELPDYDELLVQVSQQSPVLAKLALELQAIETKAKSANNKFRPKLSMNLYASRFEHRYVGKDDARAVLKLELPLTGGANQKTAVAQLQASLLAKQAEISQYQYQLRQQLLTWVQRLEQLEEALTFNEVDMEYRERDLDRARLLYEMEVRARIGKAMSDMAQAIYEGAAARFERAIIWEQIDAMLAKPETDL